MRLLRKHPAPTVVCCYTQLHPETERSLKEHVPEAELIDTSGSLLAYGQALKAHWDQGGDLVTVEHDIEVTDNVVPSFAGCKRDWCVFSYQGPSNAGYLYRSLGCTRFSRRLQKKIPFETFITYQMYWRFVDAYISRILWTVNGIEPHVHGHVAHHHDYLSGPYAVNLRPTCKELQPDGRIFMYTNNPDGTRGEFVRECPKKPWER